GSSVVVSPRKPAGPLGGRCTKVCTSSWVAYWVRYGLILRMLYSAKRHDLETVAMWAMKVSWSSIMTPRFLAVLDGARDKESVLILMLWWMTCLAGKTISSILARLSVASTIESRHYRRPPSDFSFFD